VEFSRASGALRFRCAGGSILAVTKLTLPGKKPVDALDFWNGLNGRPAWWDVGPLLATDGEMAQEGRAGAAPAQGLGDKAIGPAAKGEGAARGEGDAQAQGGGSGAAGSATKEEGAVPGGGTGTVQGGGGETAQSAGGGAVGPWGTGEGSRSAHAHASPPSPPPSESAAAAPAPSAPHATPRASESGREARAGMAGAGEASAREQKAGGGSIGDLGAGEEAFRNDSGR
jgi:hypothetical protein